MNPKAELSVKIAKVISEVQKVRKDKTNPFYKSKYANIESILGQLKPILEKNNLYISQPIIKNSLHTFIIDEKGNKYPDYNPIKTEGINITHSDPQKKGAEITFYRRYSIVSLLSLEQEDDDANSVTSNKPKYPQTKGAGVQGETTW